MPWLISSTRQMLMLRLHPFLSTFFPIYYSRISLYFDVIHSELQRAALNKSRAYFTSLSFPTFRAYFNLSFSIFAIFRPHYSTILSFYFFILLIIYHYATNRQVAGSIPDGVAGIFQWHNPSGRTMALGSTQPLTEMSTRCISWV